MSKSKEQENTLMKTAESDELSKVENKELNETKEAIAMMRLDDKHYLENQWTLWFYKKKNRVWEENLLEVSSFDTVEDFWCLFNHIKRVSQLLCQNDYYFFKYGIIPKWDDEKNIAGGYWLLQLPPLKKCSLVDEYWKQLLLSILGEVYDSSEINGAKVSVRKKRTKISLWTNNASKTNEINIMAIGRKMKEVLGIQDENLFYYSHPEVKNPTKKQGWQSRRLFKIGFIKVEK